MSLGKTGIWMPVYIGDYLADTMHLTTEQHGAYLLLLFHLWRRGSLPANDAVLAQITGLSSDAWSMAREALAEFFEIEDGCWRHRRLERERIRAALKHESNSKKAKAAAHGRWRKQELGDAPNDASSCAPGNAPGIASAMLESGKSQSQSQSQSEAEAEATADSSTSLRSGRNDKRAPDPRHVCFREILSQYWAHKNHAAPEMPWQARDAKALGEFLAASPNLGEEQFRQMLRNRAKSAVAHGDRVYLWIANLTRYQEEIGIYNKPLSAGGSNASRAEINRNSVVSAVGRALELAASTREHAGGAGQAGHEPATLFDGGVPLVDGAGSGRSSLVRARDGDHGLAQRDSERWVSRNRWTTSLRRGN